MKRLLAIGAFLATVACVWNLSISDDRPPKEKKKPKDVAVKAFMRGKLSAAEQILEGLVTEDFDLIDRGSDELRVMSMKAEWNVLKTPDYQHRSAEFRNAAVELGKMARKKKIDGAALQYLKITMSCIDCHKFVRSAIVVRLDSDPRFQHVVFREPNTRIDAH